MTMRQHLLRMAVSLLVAAIFGTGSTVAGQPESLAPVSDAEPRIEVRLDVEQGSLPQPPTGPATPGFCFPTQPICQ